MAWGECLNVLFICFIFLFFYFNDKLYTAVAKRCHRSTEHDNSRNIFSEEECLILLWSVLEVSHCLGCGREIQSDGAADADDRSPHLVRVREISKIGLDDEYSIFLRSFIIQTSVV